MRGADRLRRIMAIAPTAMGVDGQFIEERIREYLSGNVRTADQAWGMTEGWQETDARERRNAAACAYVAQFWSDLPSALAQAEAFERDLNDFESRVWPRCRHYEVAPVQLSPRHQALFSLKKIGAPNIGARTLRRLLATEASLDGQSEAA